MYTAPLAGSIYILHVGMLRCSAARCDQLHHRDERLRKAWPMAARTGTLGGDVAAGYEAKIDQLQRRHFGSIHFTEAILA